MHALLQVTAAIAVLSLLWPQDPVKPTAPAERPSTPADALTPGKVDPALLQKLAWLSGTWVLQEGDKTTEEHWRPLQGTTLLGTSHSFDTKRTTFFEYLRITAMKGSIAYIAMPGGAAPTVFQLAKLEDGVMVFENEKHDYPQRIRYEKTTAGMTATISLIDGTKPTAYVFQKKG